MINPTQLDLIRAIDFVHETWHADDVGRAVEADGLVEEYGQENAILLLASLSFGLISMMAEDEFLHPCQKIEMMQHQLGSELS